MVCESSVCVRCEQEACASQGSRGAEISVEAHSTFFVEGEGVEEECGDGFQRVRNFIRELKRNNSGAEAAYFYPSMPGTGVSPRFPRRGSRSRNVLPTSSCRCVEMRGDACGDGCGDAWRWGCAEISGEHGATLTTASRLRELERGGDEQGAQQTEAEGTDAQGEEGRLAAAAEGEAPRERRDHICDVPRDDISAASRQARVDRLEGGAPCGTRPARPAVGLAQRCGEQGTRTRHRPAQQRQQLGWLQRVRWFRCLGRWWRAGLGRRLKRDRGLGLRLGLGLARRCGGGCRCSAAVGGGRRGSWWLPWRRR